MEREFRERGVRPVKGSVRALISDRLCFDNLNFVYSAGLYDYLADRVAERLTSRLFSFLAPGGRLLIANFTPELRDIGYMEAYMDWRLIYRTTEQLSSLSAAIQTQAVAWRRAWCDDSGAIAYLELQRA